MLQHCILMDDFDEFVDFLEPEHMDEDRPRGYLCLLTRAAVHEESGTAAALRIALNQRAVCKSVTCNMQVFDSFG